LVSKSTSMLVVLYIPTLMVQPYAGSTDGTPVNTTRSLYTKIAKITTLRKIAMITKIAKNRS